MGNLFSRKGLAVCAGALAVLFAAGLFPCRFYHVLTGSMEPEIPADSLVLMRKYTDGLQIRRNDILLFSAERFGETITIMHRFSHTEQNEKGELIYRTHPEESGILDPYETTQEDILGVYLWHVPYLGKLQYFLKSPLGLCWLCQTAAILLVKERIQAGWEKDEKNWRKNPAFF